MTSNVSRIFLTEQFHWQVLLIRAIRIIAHSKFARSSVQDAVMGDEDGHLRSLLRKTINNKDVNVSLPTWPQKEYISSISLL